MAWTATIKDYHFDGRNTVVSVLMSDGVDSFAKDFVANSVAALQAEVQADVAASIASKQFLGVLPAKGTVVSLSPATPPVPTLHDVFASDVRSLNQMQRAISLGVKLATDVDYTTLKTSVTTRLTANPTWTDAF